MNNNVLSVTVLNGYIKGVFAAEEMLHDISVCGEVSGFGLRGTNAFFDLKDETSKIACSCFGMKNIYIPKNGESVIVFGSVDYWHKMGKLSFVVRSIKPLGEGALAIKLEMLKKRLREEGYFDDAHKRPIPKYPKRVCVLTSLSGAVRRDIVTTMRARNTYTDIDLADVPVQGTQAAAKICDVLALADKQGYDVIVIARGGGSMEELMPFNDEGLVEAIYAAKTPVISAVGHETDYTLCDMVADERAPTPTAAGQMLAFDANELMAYIDDTIYSCKRYLEDKISRMRSDLHQLCMRMSSRSGGRIASAKSDILGISSSMAYSIKALLAKRKSDVEAQVIKLNMLNPENMLKRGYFIIHNKDGEVNRISRLSAGEEITLTGADGRASAVVREVKNDV